MNNLKTKMEINKIPFSKLLRLELPELADEVIGIVSEHEPEVLLIEEIFTLLMAKKPEIKSLRKGYGVHPITMQLKPLREKLLLHAAAIKFQLRVVSKLRTDSNDKALTVMKTAVDLHLCNLRTSKNETILNRKVTQYFDALTSDVDLMSASTQLGFNELNDKLSEALSEIKLHLAERQKSISMQNRGYARSTAKQVVGAIKDLFKQIEVAQLKNSELDYAPLFAELNVMAAKYRNQIAIREANAKRSTAKKKESQGDGANDVPAGENEEDDVNNDTNQSIEPGVMVVAAKGAMPLNVENSNETVLNADFAENKDEKKTVASSFKQLQLPALIKRADSDVSEK